MADGVEGGEPEAEAGTRHPLVGVPPSGFTALID
ncbi:MAG: hypothetical protein JWN48_5604, partial [Myxococcaceae bacterium]|nr:hypothetical protein [Myxococcaceae bacterium]